MVREAYFDAPNLGRLIQDVWNNPGFVSPGESNQNQKQITRNVERGSLVT